MPKVVHMLTGVTTGEVSLVRRGANNKRIALTKSEGSTMTFEEMLKNVLATEAEGEQELVEQLRKAGKSDEAIQIAKSQFRFQHGFKDKLDADAMNAVSKAAGYEVAKAEKPGDEDGKPAFLDGKKKKKTEKSDDEGLEALKKSYEDRLEVADKTVSALTKTVDDIVKSTERKDILQRCEKNYAHVPGMSFEEMADILQKSVPEVRVALEKQWTETSRAVAQGNLLRSSGAISGGASGVISGAGAWGDIQKGTQALLQKSVDSDESIELQNSRAMLKSMEANPGAYDEYLLENPQQSKQFD